MAATGVRVIGRQELAQLWNVSVKTIDVHINTGRLRRVGRGLIDLDHAEVVRAGMDPSALQGALMARAMRRAMGKSG